MSSAAYNLAEAIAQRDALADALRGLVDAWDDQDGRDDAQLLAHCRALLDT